MGMEHLMSAVNPSSGYALQKGLQRHGDGAMEELKELQRQRTEAMLEACQSTESRTIRCPTPCKRARSYREYDFKTAQDLSDFIVSKHRLLLRTSWDLRQFVQAIPLSMIHSSALGKYRMLISHLAFLYRPRGAVLTIGRGEDLLPSLEASLISFMSTQKPAVKL